MIAGCKVTTTSDIDCGSGRLHLGAYHYVAWRRFEDKRTPKSWMCFILPLFFFRVHFSSGVRSRITVNATVEVSGCRRCVFKGADGKAYKGTQTPAVSMEGKKGKILEIFSFIFNADFDLFHSLPYVVTT